MLRINLLPEHFAQARAAKKMMFLFAGLIALVIVGWMFLSVNLSRQIAYLEQQYNGPKTEGMPADMPEDGYHAEAERVRAIEAEAQKLQDDRKPYGVRVDFIEALEKVPQQYVDALEGIEPYIYENARINGLDIAGGNVTMQVSTTSTSDAGRFYLNILRCPALQNVTIQVGSGGGGISAAQYSGGSEGMGGPGGGAASAGAGLIPITVTAALAKPISLPSGPGATAAAAGGAAPGMPTRPTPTAPGAPAGSSGAAGAGGGNVAG